MSGTNHTPAIAPLSEHNQCPAGCALPDAILCWRKHVRELLRDLAATANIASPDLDVLRADVAAARRRVDALLARGAAIQRGAA